MDKEDDHDEVVVVVEKPELGRASVNRERRRIGLAMTCGSGTRRSACS